MPKHTPGPWEAVLTRGKRIYIILSDKRYLCEIKKSGNDCWDADARLIAASPDLLEACKDCLLDLVGCLGDDVHVSPEMIDVHPGVKKLRAAIAKAEGADNA